MTLRRQKNPSYIKAVANSSNVYLKRSHQSPSKNHTCVWMSVEALTVSPARFQTLSIRFSLGEMFEVSDATISPIEMSFMLLCSTCPGPTIRAPKLLATPSKTLLGSTPDASTDSLFGQRSIQIKHMEVIELKFHSIFLFLKLIWR